MNTVSSSPQVCMCTYNQPWLLLLAPALPNTCTRSQPIKPDACIPFALAPNTAYPSLHCWTPTALVALVATMNPMKFLLPRTTELLTSWIPGN